MADFIYRGFGGYRLYDLASDGTFDPDEPKSYGKLEADTVKGTTATPTENDIFEEGDPVNPVISDSFPGVTSLTMRLMQQDPTARRDLMGEVLSTVDDRVVSADFGGVKNIEMALELDNRNGLTKRYYRVKVVALDEDNYNENGYMSIPVTFRVLKPLNPALPVRETIYPAGVVAPNGD